jgi:hypothetical protein
MRAFLRKTKICYMKGGSNMQWAGFANLLACTLQGDER